VIKPLLAILSPRDLDFVREAFDAIDYVDKVWVKYYPPKMAWSIARDRFLEGNWTHLIISSDDVTPNRESVALLMLDSALGDYPVITGVARVRERSMKINYPFLWIDALKNPRIVKVWFVGFALTMIRRDVVEKIPFRAFDEKRFGDFMYDLAFSVECEKHGIPKYADLRVFMEHYPSTKSQLLVGKREPKVVWEYSENPLVISRLKDLDQLRLISELKVERS